MSLSKLRETMKDRETWCAAPHGIADSRTRLGDWTATKDYNLGDSLSESSEDCNQGVGEGGQFICDSDEGTYAIKHTAW